MIAHGTLIGTIEARTLPRLEGFMGAGMNQNQDVDKRHLDDAAFRPAISSRSNYEIGKGSPHLPRPSR